MLLSDSKYLMPIQTDSKYPLIQTDSKYQTDSHALKFIHYS